MGTISQKNDRMAFRSSETNNVQVNDTTVERIYTLYEIKEMYQNLIQLIESGADPEDFKTALEVIEDEMTIKAESYKVVMDRIEADIAMIKSEEARLSDQRKSMEKSIEQMKQSLFSAMKETGTQKMKSPHYTFSIQKNAPSVSITPGITLDDKWMRIKRDPDKAAMKEALKAGEVIPGVSLVQTESLRIR